MYENIIMRSTYIMRHLNENNEIHPN